MKAGASGPTLRIRKLCWLRSTAGDLLFNEHDSLPPLKSMKVAVHNAHKHHDRNLKGISTALADVGAQLGAEQNRSPHHFEASINLEN